MLSFTVDQNGTGNFTDVQSAADAVPRGAGPVEIRIRPGVYRQKLFLEKPYLHLIGENSATTVLTYDDGGIKKMPNGEAMGTFNSYSTFIGGHDFSAENLTFENSAGLGKSAGQALAAYVDADRVCFRNCRFLGHQDTLFTGPLPPKEIVPGGFRGPRQFAERINGRQYYENCLIQGDIDFIFGSATAYFCGCEIRSNNLRQQVNGYIAVPSTPIGQKYGYVFANCNFVSDCSPESVFLFRPWRNYARAVFLNCRMGPHIKAEGFDNWNKPESEQTVFCAEYENTGSGAAPAARPSWVRQLTREQAEAYTPEKVLSGEDGWQPFENVLEHLLTEKPQ